MADAIPSLHVDTERTWRGGEQQALYLMTGLQRRGHPVTAVAAKGSPFAVRAAAEGLEVREIRARGEVDFLAARRLRAILREVEPAILHLHTSHAHLLGHLAGRKLKAIKRVVSRRVDFRVDKGWFSRYKYTRGADHYIAISQAVRQVLIDGGVPADRVSVVHSGIDLKRLEGGEPADLRAEFQLDTKAALVGNVAHLADHKDQQTLIRAVPLVAKAVPQARFFIVGQGELEKPLKALAAKLGVLDRVTFTGFRPDVPGLLRAFDLFVMSSQMEGLCTSVLDAMAAGCPVVATRAGGIPEIVEDGRSGRLVPIRDPERLAGGIVELLTDREKAGRFADAGRQRIAEHFTADAMVEATLAAYRGLL